jgi:signal transduction histidine kinase
VDRVDGGDRAGRVDVVNRARRSSGDNDRVAAVVGFVRASFTRRVGRELLFALVGLASGIVVYLVVALALVPGTAVSVVRGGTFLLLLAPTLVATGATRRVGAWFRERTARLLGETVPAPPPRPEPPPGAPWHHRLTLGLQDGPAWRALAFLVLRLPMAVLYLTAGSFWIGAVNVTYPLWWRLFRNAPPGAELDPVPLLTPVGAFEIRTYPGTFLALGTGVVMLLVAPWALRGATALDRRLVRGLLGPGRLAERVRTLEANRTQVLDDAAVTLRRIERDLHDGTQAQLATLAMHLGQAKEKLQHDADVPFDPAGALALVDAAHTQAKEALAELRNIARGIHPPALDLGLDAALATLVARSAVPAALAIDVPDRPSPAIESIAYFTAAELLANVGRHSGAGRATVDVAAHDGRLVLTVRDDGCGGASIAPGAPGAPGAHAAVGPGAGSGLAGLAERVHAVDGRLDIDSPSGGPTVVTVELPLRA